MIRWWLALVIGCLCGAGVTLSAQWWYPTMFEIKHQNYIDAIGVERPEYVWHWVHDRHGGQCILILRDTRSGFFSITTVASGCEDE